MIFEIKRPDIESIREDYIDEFNGMPIDARIIELCDFVLFLEAYLTERAKMEKGKE